MTEPCPFCKGKGRVTHRTPGLTLPDGSPAEGVVTLVCEECSGTGDLDLMRLVRAFRLGMAFEHARVIAQLAGGTIPAFPNAEFIRGAIRDDAQRQRYEDALTGRDDNLAVALTFDREAPS